MAAAAVALSGCFGSGGSSAKKSGDSHAYKVMYYDQMTKLGERFSKKIGHLSARISTERTAVGQVAAMKAVGALLKDTEASLKKLLPPKKDEKTQATLMSEFKQAEALAGTFERAAQKNDQQAVSDAASQFSAVANKIPSSFLDITIHAPD